MRYLRAWITNVSKICQFSKFFCVQLPFTEDVVYHPVFLGLLSGHPIVAVDIGEDLVERQSQFPISKAATRR